LKKIIILGASGYIGQRLIKKFLQDENEEYELHLFSRNKRKLSHLRKNNCHIHDITLKEDNNNQIIKIFKEADALYYFIHSMSEEDNDDFLKQEKELSSFISNISTKAKVKKIIYLGGLGREDENLSTHLKSRQITGNELRKNHNNVIEFRAGVIIGAGGSSFEIIRTLATKLPFIPVFFKEEGKCEAIFIDNVISYLKKSFKSSAYNNKILEIGNNEQMTYSELVQNYAKEVLNKKLFIINLSFLSFLIKPSLIGAIISFMTGQHKKLILPLIQGVSNNAVVTSKYSALNILSQDNNINRIVPLRLSFKLASDREDKGKILSVWDTPKNLSNLENKTKSFFTTQKKEGLLYEEKYKVIDKDKTEAIFEEIKKIGQKGTGYWSPYFLWYSRGIIDKLVGGSGLCNHRAINRDDLHTGDRIDFWTIEELKDKKNTKELRLIAEMKTPGFAWLQFKIVPNIENPKTSIFYLRAYFEPKGIWGYLYWYSLYVIHKFIFRTMINNILKKV
jgi:uncharacterized protein YbjT (DUF2867 family)